MDKKHWENFFEVARRALAITSQAKLKTWLHDELTKFFPHQAMMHCSGDFNLVVLNYDISLYLIDAANISVEIPKNFNEPMKLLHERWLSNRNRWFTLNKSDPLFLKMKFDGNPELSGCQYESILVYGVSEMGHQGNSLYVFLSQEPEVKVDHYVIGMLMPYLDAAVKRIKGLRPVISEQDYAHLSKREFEIMEWVNKGKTNAEIGQILSISHNTVKNHLKVVFKKLNVISRAQAVSEFSRHPGLH